MFTPRKMPTPPGEMDRKIGDTEMACLGLEKNYGANLSRDKLYLGLLSIINYLDEITYLDLTLIYAINICLPCGLNLKTHLIPI